MQIVKETILKCIGCNLKLADILVTETNDLRQQNNKKPLYTQFRIIDCPKCGGSSFPSEIMEGTTVLGTLTDDFKIEPVDTEINNKGIVINTVKLLRN